VWPLGPDSAVEPTRSQIITVSCRRSASSALGVIVGSAYGCGAAPGGGWRSAAIASSSRRRSPTAATPTSLRSSPSQCWQHVPLNCVFSERRRVLRKTKVMQPFGNIHRASPSVALPHRDITPSPGSFEDSLPESTSTPRCRLSDRCGPLHVDAPRTAAARCRRRPIARRAGHVAERRPQLAEYPASHQADFRRHPGLQESVGHGHVVLGQIDCCVLLGL
jgi:hypothetical protein